MYVIITVIRQIIEPKIVGDNLGLHPLLTLFCMIVGLKFFGAVQYLYLLCNDDNRMFFLSCVFRYAPVYLHNDKHV